MVVVVVVVVGIVAHGAGQIDFGVIFIVRATKMKERACSR